jgi:hypothetical protein
VSSRQSGVIVCDKNHRHDEGDSESDTLLKTFKKSLIKMLTIRTRLHEIARRVKSKRLSGIKNKEVDFGCTTVHVSNHVQCQNVLGWIES